MDEQNLIKSKKTSPEDKSWLEYIRNEQQQSANRLEEAAKHLATMISISLTIFLAIAANEFNNGKASCTIQVMVVLWLASLLVSFLVLFPWRYHYARESAASIKAVHKKVVLVKQVLLSISLALFLASLTILGFWFF